MDVQAWVFTNLCYFNCIDIDYSMVQFKASETTNYISIFNIFEFQSDLKSNMKVYYLCRPLLRK